ncbi:competence-and mitomycin-induced protein [Corynebacterium deserti GIMN1.010]|uniref:Competence-and mitomycin-induced protein n=1 Tax=Corynebacterium deserti GIMN1.010 TaxID=931089 RepID=A0A0M4CXU2_9CORY|nr:nicotinamide-nucleotide amidohydrolase family protein [Corynebacterium deserti]ALC06150.1 competence-and mitomycin-induced protein [Corynebacterium deserti GIMN1.010]
MAHNFASTLVDLLKSRGETVSFCESLTAGLAAATLADVPGASVVLKGGLVTYATELKTSLAGVSPVLIDAHSVISPQCAEAMAAGAARRCNSDWAVSLTGVAGPSKQDGHEVGEVWIGIAHQGAADDSQTGTFVAFRAFESEQQVILAALKEDQRRTIRELAVQRSFQLLIEYIEST